MAQIKYGAIVVNGSGKLGGHVLSNNGSTSQLKKKPTQKKSSKAVHIKLPYVHAGISNNNKLNISKLTKGWKTLSAAARLQWQTASVTVPSVDRFGNKKKLSGYTFFMRQNLNLLSSDNHIILIPPSNTTVHQTSPSTITIPDLLRIFVTPHPNVFAGLTYVLSATKCMSKGRIPSAKDYKLIYTHNWSFLLTINVAPRYRALYGDLIKDQNIWFKIVAVNSSTGYISEPSIQYVSTS